jgi:PhoPQ-activated pathogenicity-related protein
VVQQALEIYGFLPDRWEGMSATFLGKDYSIAFELFKTYEIDNYIEQRLFLRIMSVIDSIRSKIIQGKQNAKKSS